MQCRVQTAAFNRIAWGGVKDNSAVIIKPEDFWRALVLPESTDAPSTKALENILCFANPSEDLLATSDSSANTPENVAVGSQKSRRHSAAFSTEQQDAEDAEAKAKHKILEVRKNHIDMMSRIALSWDRMVAPEAFDKSEIIPEDATIYLRYEVKIDKLSIAVNGRFSDEIASTEEILKRLQTNPKEFDLDHIMEVVTQQRDRLKAAKEVIKVVSGGEAAEENVEENAEV
ncbi:hypothetical protein PHISCL_00602 [Aspergillus sclerotialis]|uniref:Uncharacterized protein n=1 Tax=Aspergillus sclerotialis TaxID=2070753 RepID=A0A3A3A067_9EURO|nr:hypothetical protein PHISCL_00602 [Aspergillus sclerotialis]